jgi:hypothetical protein
MKDMFSMNRKENTQENSIYIDILLMLSIGIKPHFIRQLGDCQRGYLDRHIGKATSG